MSCNTSLKGGILMKKFSNDLVSSMSKDLEHSSDEELHIPDGITTMALT